MSVCVQPRTLSPRHLLLVWVLVKANASEDPKTRLDDDEIIAEMFTLTLAGHETTSSALTFLLYELSKHQEYQACMREEIGGVRARITARGGNEFTIEDLDSLTPTMNAIKVRLVISTLAALLRTNRRVLTVLDTFSRNSSVLSYRHRALARRG